MKVIIIKEIIKIPILNHFKFEINRIIKIVDKFNKKKDALSPERKIRTSIKINKIEIK